MKQKLAIIKCSACSYSWQPRKLNPKECPECHARLTKQRKHYSAAQATKEALSNKSFMEVVNTPRSKRKYVAEESIGSSRQL